MQHCNRRWLGRHLLFYEATTGHAESYTTGRGALGTIIDYTGWRTTRAAILPGDFGGM